MTFTEALMSSDSGWIRRRGWPGFIFIGAERCSIPGDLTRHDILADDWEFYIPSDEERKRDQDDAEIRFSLLELE